MKEEGSSKKKVQRSFKFLVVISLLFLLVGCSGNSKKATKGLPELQFSWDLDLHTALPFIPLNRVETFKKKGIYLKIISDDKYELVEDGKALAIISFVATKSGAEIANMMGQKHLDAGLGSNVAILTGIDSGSDIKIICPIQTGGMAFVVRPEIPVNNWTELKRYIGSSPAPIVIGYHSPVSGPRILIEYIFREAGFRITEDPSRLDADVLMVDLKGQNNLLPSLLGKQVEGWAGPTAFPEIAEERGIGKIVMPLEQFPPAGTWGNFPCCVFSAREEITKEYPEVIKAFARLLTETCEYAMVNREDAALIFSEVVGVEKETTEKSTISYTTNPDANWLAGIQIYVSSLNEMGKFNGRLKGKPFQEVVDKAFDFSFIKEVLAER